MMYVVVMLEEHLQVRQDDYKDEFVQLYYYEMTEAVVGVVDQMEELEYVDCQSHQDEIDHEMMIILVDDGMEVVEMVLVEKYVANHMDLLQMHLFKVKDKLVCL